MELILDLEDGLPPVKQEMKSKTAKANGAHHPAEIIQQVLIPHAVVIAVRPVHCACGAEHKDHLGVFVENRTPHGARVLKRVELKELPAFAALPRKVDIAPIEEVPVCIDCWAVDKAYDEAVARAVAEDQPTILQGEGI